MKKASRKLIQEVRLASLSLRLRSTLSRHRARASPVRLSKEEAVGKGEIIRLTAVHLLTQIKSCSESRLGDGSAGRTRTYNPSVNSRMLCH